MYCPNCGKKAEGKWCEYCGARIEIDDDFIMSGIDRETPDSDTYDVSPSNFDNTNANGTDEQSYIPYENDYAYKADEKEKVRKKKIIIALSIAGVLLISALVFIALYLNGNFGKTDDKTVKSSSEMPEEIVSLKEKADKFMEIGDYESCESILKQIIDSYDDSESELLYKIVFNYNQSVKKLDDYKYKEAAKYFSKIPDECIDYPIYDDIDSLGSEITRYENAYKIFNSIGDFISNNDFESAREAIDILDDTVLSKKDKEILESYKEELSESETKNEIELSEHEAEDLIRGYCDSFVNSINESDFSLVEPYLYKGSPIYNMQKKLVTSYIADRITERFDSLKLNSLKRNSDTKWSAAVTEAETVYYANGSQESKSYSWVYTIEYIDGSFYLTEMK